MSALTVFGNGRLTHEVELKRVSTQKGEQSLCNINLAFDNGKDRDSTFKSFECWGKTAENAAKYLSKGDMVAVNATVLNNNYERDGQKVYSDRLLVNKLEYLSKAKKKEDSVEKTSEEVDLPF